MKKIELFTDGACSGNPGNGGWGYILKYKTAVKESFGGCQETTNNQTRKMYLCIPKTNSTCYIGYEKSK